MCSRMLIQEEEEVMICNLGKQRVSDIDRIIDV